VMVSTNAAQVIEAVRMGKVDSGMSTIRNR
jgi:hypothetical protein